MWVQWQIVFDHCWLILEFYRSWFAHEHLCKIGDTLLEASFCLLWHSPCQHSDNVQQFVCTAFTEFMQSWRIIHSTSSPGHQSANGKAEAAVKSVKNMLKRTSFDKSDQYLALLEMRNTPRQDVNGSPAQIVFGRFARSVLAVFLKPCTALDVRKRPTHRCQIKKCYDRRARPLRKLHANQPVYFQHLDGRVGLEAPLCAALARVRTL